MRMSRVHAFELHELAACPSFFRRIATEYLTAVGEAFRAFEPVTPLLVELLRGSGEKSVVDLCSGAGGPILTLAARAEAELGFAPEVVLTDLNPEPQSLTAARARTRLPVRVELDSIDARAIPERLHGVRTLFDAFHHFRPDDARRILADAAARRARLLIVEATERSVPAILGMLLAVPLLVFALTPFVRPFSVWRLFFTYIVPVAVPLIVFDGVVSCLRSYTLAELRELAAGLDSDAYRFEIGTLRSRGQRLTYVVGAPR
jgi:hypothetical protein